MAEAASVSPSSAEELPQPVRRIRQPPAISGASDRDDDDMGMCASEQGEWSAELDPSRLRAHVK
ncbi:hypothetical protein GCM10018780_29500 [Streptomyces lanatus]|nr:hypothetical protein GCM10018780_29500 [Streptomyces lanatus]